MASTGSSGDSNAESESDDILGANLAKINKELRSKFSLDDDLNGVVVLEVHSQGLAARNGFREGDVITSVNNSRVDKPSEVTDRIKKAKNDGKSKIVVLLQRNNSSRFIAFDLSD